MNSERERPRPLTIFPIEEPIVKRSLDWLHTAVPSQSAVHTSGPTDRLVEQLAAQQNMMGFFINNMALLRQTLQTNRKSRPIAYKNGAILMKHILEEKAHQNDTDLITPSDTRLTDYICELLGSEKAPFPIKGTFPGLRGERKMGRPVTFLNVLPNSGTPKNEGIRHAFQRNSEDKKDNFLINEPYIAKALVNPALLREYSLHTEGIFFGALDMYETYRRQEWYSNWEKINNVRMQ